MQLKRLHSFLVAMRIHQWMKNILIFVPLLASHTYNDSPNLIQSTFAFVIFSLTASAVYFFNDLMDLKEDKLHPHKRNRPIAGGEFQPALIKLSLITMLLGSFALAYFLLPLPFLMVLTAYLILNLLYSLKLKQIVIIDVLTLACFYTLRIIAGAAAISIHPTSWLLAFSLFIFLSLAMMKRFVELKTHFMSPGRGYKMEDLNLLSTCGISAGYLSVLVLAFYIQDNHSSVMYQKPFYLWLATPVLLFWITRVWLLAHRNQVHDDPIVFALRDTISLLTAMILFIIFALARLG